MQQQHKNVQVELAHEDDWADIRDCFVHSFFRYPLYTYLIPDDKIRPTFLRHYLEAIYDVCIRDGSALLLCISTNKKKVDENKVDDTRVVIGGVVYGSASETGGWKCAKNEDFEEAYKRHKLYEIDSDAMMNLARYEEWEHQRITKHVTQSGIPMWNGAFCAIDPAYAGRGLGSLIYAECTSLLQQAHSEAVAKLKLPKSGHLQRFLCLLSPKKSHVMKPKEAMARARLCKQQKTTEVKVWKDKRSQFLFVLTHDARSLKFHEMNGMHCVAKTTYETPDEVPPFEVHILVMDPFNTGKLGECVELLQENYQTEIATKMSNEKHPHIELVHSKQNGVLV